MKWFEFTFDGIDSSDTLYFMMKTQAGEPPRKLTFAVEAETEAQAREYLWACLGYGTEIPEPDYKNHIVEPCE
jgi:hypothetical protein